MTDFHRGGGAAAEARSWCFPAKGKDRPPGAAWWWGGRGVDPASPQCLFLFWRVFATRWRKDCGRCQLAASVRTVTSRLAGCLLPVHIFCGPKHEANNNIRRIDFHCEWGRGVGGDFCCGNSKTSLLIVSGQPSSEGVSDFYRCISNKHE